MNNLSINQIPWRPCVSGYFNFKIRTLQVLGIREDPGGCIWPFRALGAFLFLEVQKWKVY